MSNAYVIGVDFGTDSVRSVLVAADSGQEVAAAVFAYPRWRDGLYCNARINQFRQHPLDYIEGLQHTIRACLQQAGPGIAPLVKGISVDTTGSTPIAVDKTGTPLSLRADLAENPNAMFVLWKDHTATKEAAEINAHGEGTPYLKYVGGIYSSEWFWAKLLHILREDESIRSNIHSFVEHCDWIPFLLTGGNDAAQLKRGICSAGHKALWADEFGGLPPDSFFTQLDPLLGGFTNKLFTRTYTSAEAAGHLSKEWAERLGLSTDVIVGIGAFDCHMGAVGGQIEPYYLSKVMGTSTCDMLVAPKDEVEGILVKGICGQVDGSIIPGMIGMEAGQSAFGDAYAWLKQTLSWPLQWIDDAALRQQISDRILTGLSAEASALQPTESSELALDWLNGRRTPDANQLLKGAFTGISLGTDAPRLFRALVEATCFGARAIADRFVSEGIPVKGLIGMGGVARKSPFIMQMMADVMNRPIRIHKSDQTCAAGAAMFAATAAGLYPRVEEAMQAMGQGFDLFYEPDPKRSAIYDTRYQNYQQLGNFLS
ncbi:MAG: ribulokinase [Sphingobacteriales bacterium SCN 48-20]|uniref:ribulokinase n=1 Tax=Terrimonas ferruginea TaxID=249 RepID=UPI00086F1483|nr:ribulokinase [Terrimonas ferruginea]MBN8782007.1 ribulokinase [Terrimonas ferruginea]ODT90549.1 MAG: ribulokinase [Sphingobacteriales bacterium SCN 48-20]OJW45138.1 MAG: ribulokinase [Sphingobacteriales bacterium 48-107]